METVQRVLNLDLPAGRSAFLWGPRKTGKTTYLEAAYPDAHRYDFLKTDLFMDFTKRPFLLREQLLALDERRLAQPVILDEVQKVPQVMDEVHWLIENRNLSFILCGSSARKLKRGHANMLGGRAWRYEMFPLVSAELGAVDLLRALNHGMIPEHYLMDNPRRTLKAYVQDYLKEEVFDEGLTRNIPAFSRFFEAVGYSHGELINYANIARDCGVSAKTVREYYQILVDTLLGVFIPPFKKKRDRQVISRTPKFYLFDVGVAGAMTGRSLDREKGAAFGKALEHFLITELLAHRSYRELDYDIRFWRTKSGSEVDVVLGGGDVAVEIKGTDRLDSGDLRPLRVFAERYRPRSALVVCNEAEELVAGGIRILPWRRFLQQLWDGEIIS